VKHAQRTGNARLRHSSLGWIAFAHRYRRLLGRLYHFVIAVWTAKEAESSNGYEGDTRPDGIGLVAAILIGLLVGGALYVAIVGPGQLQAQFAEEMLAITREQNAH
jgi:hypothetical protein